MKIHGKTMRTPLGELRIDKRALADANAEIGANIIDAVDFFPESVRSTVQGALDETRKRVLRAGGAAVGLEMLREMTEGLGDIARGDAEIVSREDNPDESVRMILRTTGNDEFKVWARPRRNKKGQARIGITQTKDDGVELPREFSLGLRLDRDPRFGATIDVEFGRASFNKQVHGYKRVGRKGKIPNHHFRDGLRPINHPDKFAEVVSNFQNDTLTVL